MKQVISFTTLLPPSVNAYLGKRVAYNPITKKPFVQVYETQEAKAFKKNTKKVIERALKESEWKKTGEFQYVDCNLVVYINQKKRDTDNLFKCLLDCFTECELVYDDSMVIPKVQDVFIDSKNPRVEVTLCASDKVGIFLNEFKLEQFEAENCRNCSRFNRNCSIRKDSIENRVREEIDTELLRCSAKKEKRG